MPIVTALLLLAAAPAVRPKLLVLDIAPAAAADAALAQTISGAVVSELEARGYFEVLSTRDIVTMLGIERQKQLLGCTDDSGSCNAEIAGALGSRLVLVGSLSRFGEAYQLTLQLVDNEKRQVMHRSNRLAKNADVLRLQVIYAVAEVTGAPLPPAPSKVPSYSLIAGGTALLIAGVSLGIFTLASEATVNAELEQGRMFSQVLKSYDYYREQSQRAGIFRSLALAGLCAGAAMVVLGIVLQPPDIVASSTLKVAAYFTGDGLGLALAIP